MNIFWPVFHPTMKLHNELFVKLQGLASYYNSKWYVLYVQTAKEAADKIPLAAQRHLINNFKNATELGAEVIQKKGRKHCFSNN